MYNSMNSGRTRGRTTKTSYPLGLTRCATRRGTLGLTLSIVAAGAVFMTTPNTNAQDFPDVRPACFKTAAVFCTRANCSGTGPLGMDIANLMGFAPGITDAFPEVAVANSKFPYSVTIFKNTGDWAANPPSNGLEIHAVYPTPVNRTVFDVAFGDFDNDNDLDLAVSVGPLPKIPGSLVFVLVNDGSGQYTSSYTIENLLASPIDNLEVGDFDADGTVDIALAGAGPSGNAAVELLWNQGGGSYQHQVFESTTFAAVGFSIDSGRVKPNSNPLFPLDIVMSMHGDDKMLVLINDGAGNFTASTQDAADSRGIAIGHFHAGQPAPDLALSELFGDFNTVYWGDVNENFGANFQYPLRGGLEPFGVDVGHLNGDANEDIVVVLSRGGPFGHGGIAVFPGYVNGTFRVFEDIENYIFDVQPGGQPKPCYVQIADMNQDGFPDVVTSNFNTDRISVLINCLVATPGP